MCVVLLNLRNEERCDVEILLIAYCICRYNRVCSSVIFLCRKVRMQSPMSMSGAVTSLVAQARYAQASICET
jgi:hypothetical protein